MWSSLNSAILFQSTPPARGATMKNKSKKTFKDISIHAPREGGDFISHKLFIAVPVISIHAPREGGDPRTI